MVKVTVIFRIGDQYCGTHDDSNLASDRVLEF